MLVTCLVLALAGARLALPADRLSVVFLLDASASMLDATREELVEWARSLMAESTVGLPTHGWPAELAENVVRLLAPLL